MGAVAESLKWLMNQLGYAVCHQLPERSLHYGGQKLPVCARDTGFFLGFAACLLVLLLFYRRDGDSYPSWRIVAVLAALVVPAILDAVSSYSGLRETTNAVRVVTGALAGTGVAALVFPISCRQLFDPDDGIVVLERWWYLPALLMIPATVSLSLWPDWPGAYWLWAPLVSMSILFVLLVLNMTLLSLMIDWLRQGARISCGDLACVAAAAALVELVCANRLHWLVDRFF